MVVGAAIQCASNGIAMYLVARWLLGFGIPMYGHDTTSYDV